MRQLEKELKKEIRNTKITKAILGTIGTVGLLSVVVMAPNIFQVLRQFGYKPDFRTAKSGINRSLKRLLDAGYVKFENTEKGKFLRLTEDGRNRLDLIEAYDYKIKEPKKWDKKWRIVIFDIKENRRALRGKLRRTLMSVGFVNLQKSVWVYPYDCEDLITMLKADFKIGKDILYIIADKIENDKKLRKDFLLP